MIYVNQNYVEKGGKIIAYPELLLEVASHQSLDNFTLKIEIPPYKKKAFYSFAKSLGFVVGEVKTPPEKLRHYID